MGPKEGPLELLRLLGEDSGGLGKLYQPLIDVGGREWMEYSTWEMLAGIVMGLELRGQKENAERIERLAIGLLEKEDASWAPSMARLLLLLFGAAGDASDPMPNPEARLMSSRYCEEILEADVVGLKDAGYKDLLMTGGSQALGSTEPGFAVPPLEEVDFHRQVDRLAIASRVREAPRSNGIAKKSEVGSFPGPPVEPFWQSEEEKSKLQLQKKKLNSASRAMYLTELPETAFLGVYELHFAPESGATEQQMSSEELCRLMKETLTGYAPRTDLRSRLLPSRRKAFKACMESCKVFKMLNQKVQDWKQSSGPGSFSLRGLAQHIEAILDGYVKLSIDESDQPSSSPLAVVLRSRELRHKLDSIGKVTEHLSSAASSRDVFVELNRVQEGRRGEFQTRRELSLALLLPCLPKCYKFVLMGETGDGQNELESLTPSAIQNLVRAGSEAVQNLKSIDPQNEFLALRVRKMNNSLEDVKAGITEFLEQVENLLHLPSLGSVGEDFNVLDSSTPADALLEIMVARPVGIICKALASLALSQLKQVVPIHSMLLGLQRCFVFLGTQYSPDLMDEWARLPPRTQAPARVRAFWEEWIQYALDKEKRASLEPLHLTVFTRDYEAQSTTPAIFQLAIEANPDVPLLALFPSEVWGRYLSIFRMQVRLQHCATLLKRLYVESRDWDAVVSEKVNGIRWNGTVLVNALGTLMDEHVHNRAWPELSARAMEDGDLSTLRKTHYQYLTTAEQWSFLDEASTPARAAIIAIIDAVAALAPALSDEHSRPQLVDHARIQVSLSLLILAQALTELVNRANPLDHHIQLLLRLDLNRYLTREPS